MIREDTKHLSGTIDETLIKSFIEDNYVIWGSYIIKDNIVDVEGSIKVKNYKIETLTNRLFSFGVVNGDFSCEFCDSLITLKGAPKEVGGNFDCRRCRSLTTLEGAPKKVGGSFICRDCPSLKS